MERPPTAVAFATSLTIPGFGHMLRGNWLRGLAWFTLLPLAVAMNVVFVRAMFWKGALAIWPLYLCGAIAAAIHSIVVPASPRRLPAWVMAFIYLALAAMLGMAALAVRARTVQLMHASSQAMSPAILQGDTIWFDNRPARYSAGDVVIAHVPGKGDLIRRISSGRDPFYLRADAFPADAPAEAVPASALRGRALFVWLSFGPKGMRWERLGQPIH